MPTKIDHTGHRDRLRERIMQSGLDSLESHEILEYLLFAFVPRRNTNDIAHRLLDTFGSFANVLDAPRESLCAVEGMTQNAALFLSSLSAINARYTDDKNRRECYLEKPAAAARYLCGRIGNLPYECFAALCLDVRGNLLGVVQVRSQASDSVYVNVRELIRRLATTRAVNVIVAHNHPSGNVDPSPQDRDFYKRLEEALSAVEIKILDCLVVSGNRYYSFAVNEECTGKMKQAMVADGEKQRKDRFPFAPYDDDELPELLSFFEPK